ncbi:MAG TPA: AAA family ATPase [Vicinamibacterales bacterium]|nr:AAA family ATPase [Vicinamibacterales bacterium]HWI19210.1 AAA family ATPase [Vicinamibacterales bacterium]
MKVEFVEIAGFRGVREKMRLDFAPAFVVVTGRNGVGKSTVFDAIDFALTGVINKFAVTGAKGGGLEEHIWWVGEPKADAHYVSIGFVDEQGAGFSITRTRERGFIGDSAEILTRLCRPGWVGRASMNTLIQTTLIRDELIAALSLDLPEQARFTAVRAAMGAITGPDYSARTEAVLKAAVTLKDAQKAQVEQVQADLGRTLTALTEARSAAEQSTDVSEALRITESVIGSVPAGPAERQKALRTFVANKKVALRELEDTRLRAEALVGELKAAASVETTRQTAAAKEARSAAAREKKLAEQRLELALRLDAAERESDAQAAHFAALLQHGSALGLQDGHCPLCSAFRTAEEFSAAISSATERLKERGERLASAAAALQEAQSAVAAASKALELADSQIATLEGRRAFVEQQLQSVAQTYMRHNFDAPADDPVSAQQLIFREQENIASVERALFILESSTAADRLTSLEARVVALREQIDQLTGKLADAENVVESARQIDASSRTVANEVLTEQFDTVMPLLKELYRRLRPHPDWSEIESDFGGRVRGSLNFVVGDGRNPQFLFSSGQRRAAGLSFLLAVHLSRPWCAWESLLLDDPVQHIDDYRAVNLAEVLTAVRRTGEQVIVAVEDPALADLLCRRLRSGGDQIGRRFDLRTANTGGAVIGGVQDIYPLPRNVLSTARAS